MWLFDNVAPRVAGLIENSQHFILIAIYRSSPCLSFVVSACAAASCEAGVSAELDRCTKALKCEVNVCASNGSLKSCYGRSNFLWGQAIAQLEARLDKKDGWCASYWAELKDAQARFAEQAIEVKSLWDGPYNTDDDLALLMYQQQYELAYSVSKKSACNENY